MVKVPTDMQRVLLMKKKTENYNKSCRRIFLFYRRLIISSQVNNEL